MVVSDSTIARVLTWLHQQESKQFVRSFFPHFDRLGLLQTALEPLGVPGRIGIIDGSVMGTHHHVTFTLHGRIDYSLIIEEQKQHGKELPTALRVMDEAYSVCDGRFLDLLLADSLYFNVNTFWSARKKRSYPDDKKRKSRIPYAMLQEAKFAFEHETNTKTKTASAFDQQRFCTLSTQTTSGEFAGFPIQIVHLVEDYLKRTANAHSECWIVTTDLSLSPFAVREAAHLRWHIENYAFKRLLHLTGTKRLFFKDPRPFFTMLRLFCDALTAFDAYIRILKQTPRKFTTLCRGIKPTWKNIFSRLRDQLKDAAGDW